MQSKSQQQYFDRCLLEASKSPMGYKLGAVLVKGGKVLSGGFNHTRTGYAGTGATPKCRGYITPASFHAEMHALFTALGGISPSFKAQAISQESCLQPDISSGRTPQLNHWRKSPRKPIPAAAAAAAAAEA